MVGVEVPEALEVVGRDLALAFASMATAMSPTTKSTSMPLASRQ